MIYRNIKTGAEIITKSVIQSPNYILVEKKEAPIKEPPIKESKQAEPKAEPKKVSKVKSAPKKKGSRK